MTSLKQLSYIVAVEKTLHFKKAAELSKVSQSALSTAINALEKQLGLHIFERDNKKVLVTPVGAQILHRARAILEQVDDLHSLAEESKPPLSYPMTLGMIPTICPYLLPKILPSLHKQYPQCELCVVEEQSYNLIEKVRRGEIDAAILALPYPCEGLLTMDIGAEDFYWVTTKNGKFSKQAKISNRELQESNLLLLNDGHCFKDHALEACKLSDPKTTRNLGASSLNTLIQMVIGGFGTTLVPKMAIEQLLSQHKSLSTVQLSEPGPHRRLAIILRPNYTRMSSIEALVALSKAALAKD